MMSVANLHDYFSAHAAKPIQPMELDCLPRSVHESPCSMIVSFSTWGVRSRQSGVSLSTLSLDCGPSHFLFFSQKSASPAGRLLALHQVAFIHWTSFLLSFFPSCLPSFLSSFLPPARIRRRAGDPLDSRSVSLFFFFCFFISSCFLFFCTPLSSEEGGCNGQQGGFVCSPEACHHRVGEDWVESKVHRTLPGPVTQWPSLYTSELVLRLPLFFVSLFSFLFWGMGLFFFFMGLSLSLSLLLFLLLLPSEEASAGPPSLARSCCAR